MNRNNFFHNILQPPKSEDFHTGGLPSQRNLFMLLNLSFIYLISLLYINYKNIANIPLLK